MSQIYEGMFLLDNDAVREGWEGAKALVTSVLEKHQATVLTARRWDERRLAYPINGSRRATYLLAYYEIPQEEIPAMRREFDLSEQILRYLFLSVDAIPDDEEELTKAESAEDFEVPEPPDDDAPDPEPEPEPDPEGEGKPTEGTPEPSTSKDGETTSTEPATTTEGETTSEASAAPEQEAQAEPTEEPAPAAEEAAPAAEEPAPAAEEAAPAAEPEPVVEAETASGEEPPASPPSEESDETPEKKQEA